MRHLVFFIIVLTCFAKDDPRVLMRGVLKDYIELIPYIYEGRNNYSEKELQQISNRIHSLKEKFKKASKIKDLDKSHFHPSLSIVNDSIEEISEIQELNDLIFSRYRLRSFVSSCISCHSQLPANKYSKITYFKKSIIQNNVFSHYDLGMIYFLLRDYYAAIGEFKTHINKYKSSKSLSTGVDKSLLNLLSIYLKVNQDTESATKQFIAFDKMNIGTRGTQRLIKSWVKRLIYWNNNDDLLSNRVKLKSYLKKNGDKITKAPLGTDTGLDVDRFLLQGKLNESLRMEKINEQVPFYLYWIGKIENNLNSFELYSLGDLYLKECVMNFSKSQWARKCLEAYEESIELGFTGSGGTKIPPEVMIELNNLKAKLKN